MNDPTLPPITPDERAALDRAAAAVRQCAAIGAELLELREPRLWWTPAARRHRKRVDRIHDAIADTAIAGLTDLSIGALKVGTTEEFARRVRGLGEILDALAARP